MPGSLPDASAGPLVGVQRTHIQHGVLKGTGQVPQFHCPAAEITVVFGQIRHSKSDQRVLGRNSSCLQGALGPQCHLETPFDSIFLVCLSSRAESDPQRGSSGSSETPSENVCEWGWGGVSHSFPSPPFPGRRRPAALHAAGREPEDEDPRGMGLDQ